MFRNALLHFITKIYGWVITFGSNLQSLFLLWMRLTWGHQFLLSGSAKLANMEQTFQVFATYGFSHSHAYLVSYLELIGGILLMVGFASRLVAIPLAIATITALSTAHASFLAHFKFITEPSTLVSQSPYPFLITCLLVLCFGPGRVSLDAWIKRWVDKQPRY